MKVHPENRTSAARALASVQLLLVLCLIQLVKATSVPTWAMTKARANHTANLIPNGKISSDSAFEWYGLCA